MLTLGSLFDGIGGWLLAAQHAGIEPIWASEIAPFPASVTAHHFPNVVRLGDIQGIQDLPPVDIVTCGSPCQDLSVAGKRKGLSGERSGLFIRAVELVRRLRMSTGGRYPRFFVWENVPGAFSSNSGADFRAVLEEIGQTSIPMPEGGKWANAGLAELPECEIAWRVLDAQHHVPQRRKRIFLVADFGTERRCAGEILLISESVSRDSSESREAREGTSAGTESGAYSTVRTYQNTGRGWWNESSIAETLRTPCGGDSTKANLAYIPSKARSLTARNDGSPCVDRGPDIVAAGFKVGNSEAAHSIGYAVETSPTLSAMDSGNKPAVAVYENHGQDSRIKGPLKTAPAINAKAGTGGNNLPLVSCYCVGNGQLDQAKLSNKVGALNCMHDQQAVMIKKSVRRLTPTECERLQGLPDGYTLIDDKSCSDTARYKALGNGMAQPCADYVIRRIVEVMA